MAKRVYFAFHYQDVIDFRANVVRKHNFLEGVESAGYYDHSIWEESKKQGPIALKRMINAGLDNTSVTAVLIGSNTYARRWVRYEIIRSMVRSNRLIGVHINSIAGKDKLTKQLGPDPFDYLAVQFSSDGWNASILEHVGGSWIPYLDHEAYRLAKQRGESDRGKAYKLSHYYSVYDWVLGNGYNNFATWIGD